MLVLVANCTHGPLVLLFHVAFIVSLFGSVSVMFSITFSGSLVFPFVGCSLECVGCWFVVKLYVELDQFVPSVRFTLHQYLVLLAVKLLLVLLMFVPVFI